MDGGVGNDRKSIRDGRKVTMMANRQDLSQRCPGLRDRYIVKGAFLWGKPIKTNRRYHRGLQRTSCVPDREMGSKDAVNAQDHRAQALVPKGDREAEGDSCQASGWM